MIRNTSKLQKAASTTNYADSILQGLSSGATTVWTLHVKGQPYWVAPKANSLGNRPVTSDAPIPSSREARRVFLSILKSPRMF